MTNSQPPPRARGRPRLPDPQQRVNWRIPVAHYRMIPTPRAATVRRWIEERLMISAPQAGAGAQDAQDCARTAPEHTINPQEDDGEQ